MSPNLSAWDDNWEKSESSKRTFQAREPKISRDEFLQKHEEENERIIDAAQAGDIDPTEFQLQQRGDDVGFRNEMKPTFKLLSRRPPTKDIVSSCGADETKPAPAHELTPEELLERQLQDEKERKEKLERYQQIRARLFGSESPTGESSPASASQTGGGGSGYASASGSSERQQRGHQQRVNRSPEGEYQGQQKGHRHGNQRNRWKQGSGSGSGSWNSGGRTVYNPHSRPFHPDPPTGTDPARYPRRE